MEAIGRYKFKTKLRDSQFTESRDTGEIILKTGNRNRMTTNTTQSKITMTCVEL